jgi:hypothetical protein
MDCEQSGDICMGREEVSYVKVRICSDRSEEVRDPKREGLI